MLNITYLNDPKYETIALFEDVDTSFRCYIAIDSLKLGPALGGCRMKYYDSDADALTDVLRLAEGMTYKNSIANLNFGGGKAVIPLNEKMSKMSRKDIFSKFADCVEFFDGRYITAEDVGTNVSDMKIISEITDRVVLHDGSSMTGLGVYSCMATAIGFLGLNPNQISYFVEGLGKVGGDVYTRLYNSVPTNNIYVYDINQEILNKSLDEQYVHCHSPDDLIDVYIPCALGATLNNSSLEQFSLKGVKVICGSANNQLVNDEIAEKLLERNIVYCPDFLVNAGGVIDAACEIGQQYNGTLAQEMTLKLSETLIKILTIARDEKINTNLIAKKIAEERFS